MNHITLKRHVFLMVSSHNRAMGRFLDIVWGWCYPFHWPKYVDYCSLNGIFLKGRMVKSTSPCLSFYPYLKSSNGQGAPPLKGFNITMNLNFQNLRTPKQIYTILKIRFQNPAGIKITLARIKKIVLT